MAAVTEYLFLQTVVVFAGFTVLVIILLFSGMLSTK